jgi:hypothetical protein
MAGFLPIDFISGRSQMLAKFMTVGLVGSALLATVAFARTPTATDSAKSSPSVVSDSSMQGNWRASKLVGLRSTTTPVKVSARSTIS